MIELREEPGTRYKERLKVWAKSRNWNMSLVTGNERRGKIVTETWEWRWDDDCIFERKNQILSRVETPLS